jgi:hypothetical protein
LEALPARPIYGRFLFVAFWPFLKSSRLLLFLLMAIKIFGSIECNVFRVQVRGSVDVVVLGSESVDSAEVRVSVEGEREVTGGIPVEK